MSETPSAADLHAPPGAFTIEEFARAYRIGRSTVYELIDRGELQSFHIGRRRLVSYEAALRWQRAREKAEAAGT